MKRLINAFFALTTAVTISLVFAGCTQQAEQPAKTAPPSVEQPEQPEQPAKTDNSAVEHPK